MSSLKHCKDFVKEAVVGLEVRIGVQDFKNFQTGNCMEFFRVEKTEQVSDSGY